MSRADAVRAAPATRWTLATALGGWWVASLLSQHPHRGFDRLRDFEPLGLLLPNWRFFAPEPAQHDFHLLHRVLTDDEQQTDWVETLPISVRTNAHAVWYPLRRENKAMSDLANELVRALGVVDVPVESTVPFRLLRDRVELTVRAEWEGRPLPRGFQFLVAQYTGHDDEQQPEYLVASSFVPLA